MPDRIQTVLNELECNLAESGYCGYDPFDALNSPLIRTVTCGNRYLGRAALQLFKRSPINMRSLFRVRTGVNPKAYGLLVSTYVTKYILTNDEADIEKAKEFADWLLANTSKYSSGASWGYNFDWPNRNTWVPAYTPTIVNTAYIGQALIDLSMYSGVIKYKQTVISAADFIFEDLNSTIVDDGLCLSYTPLDKTLVHNANMLGSALLARIYSLTGDDKILEYSKRSMRFSIEKQRDDGSWFYGEEPGKHWIDSYHTAYNLLALKSFIQSLSDNSYNAALEQGYNYYLDNFFTDDGYVRYYHNRIYPWDGHAMAHALLTLSELEYLDPTRSSNLRNKVLTRVLDSFYKGKGRFVYQVNRFYKNRINYFRWVQCWMFYALMRLNLSMHESRRIHDGKS